MDTGKGMERLPHRSDAQRRAVVEQYQASSLSVAAFCRQTGISAGSLQRWRGACATATKAASTGSADWLDVGALAPERALMAGPAGGLELRLDWGGGVVVTIRRD